MNSLKYVVAAAIAAAALPGTAEAAEIVAANTTVMAAIDPGATSNNFTIGFSDSNLASPSFNEFLTFTTDVAGMLNVLVSTTTTSALNDTDFSNIFLSGTGIAAPISIAQILADPNETRALNGFNVGAGTFTINFQGTPGTQSGSFGGTVAFQGMAAAVPEPGTWAMMLLGFGAIGFSMRRRRTQQTMLQMG